MFPTYLLTDKAFWLFTVLYVAGAGIAVILLLWPVRNSAPKQSIVPILPGYVPVLFTLLLIYQFFHQAEHVTQMYQFGFLEFQASESHGFVWFLDEEWNHFVFNIGYMTGVSIVYFEIFRAMKRVGAKFTAGAISLMVIFLAFEGWHCIEHTWRIIQHVQGICGNNCVGILDPLTGINRLLIHFWFNFFALAFPAAVYFQFGIQKKFMKKKNVTVTMPMTA